MFQGATHCVCHGMSLILCHIPVCVPCQPSKNRHAYLVCPVLSFAVPHIVVLLPQICVMETPLIDYCPMLTSCHALVHVTALH